MVPGSLDRDAGRVVPDQEAGRPWLGVVGAGPDRHPAQPHGTGGEDLVTSDLPACRARVAVPVAVPVPTAGDRLRQAAAGRGAELRLDPERVDEHRFGARLGQGLLIHLIGPRRGGSLGGVREERHRGDQRHRRVTPAERVQDARRAGQADSRAAVAAVDGRGQQSGLVDDADARSGEVGGAVVVLRVRRQRAGDLGQPVELGRCYADYIDGHSRHYASREPVTSARGGRCAGAFCGLFMASLRVQGERRRPVR